MKDIVPPSVKEAGDSSDNNISSGSGGDTDESSDGESPECKGNADNNSEEDSGPTQKPHSEDGSNDDGFNPQEPSVLDQNHLASTPPSDFNVKVYDDSQKASVNAATGADATILPENDGSGEPATIYNAEASSSKAREMRKRKSYRHRKSHIIGEANIDKVRQGKGLSLPSYQYDAVLIRRAIRKIENTSSGKEMPTNSNSTVRDESSKVLDVYGDISLGMKLSVVAGKVIVQHLKALDDGRASPAQLTGVISRGDVLLCVNHKSLVNLPLDVLMNRLSPLSTPDSTGRYQRRIKLRFAKRIGIDLLISTETTNAMQANAKNLDTSFDVARDMLALFPMVDQLSGMPYFEDQALFENAVSPPAGEVIRKEETDGESPVSSMIKPVSLNEIISKDLASCRTKDRHLFLHECETWEDNLSESVQQVESAFDEHVKDDVVAQTLPELVAIGRSAMLGANNISKQVEDVDSGKDLRSFRSWNTSLSLHSRASQRRKRVFDDASLPPNFGRVDEDTDENSTIDGMNSIQSMASDDDENVDGDELLLRLASHDEIWRKQVVDFLEKAARGFDDNESTNHEEDKEQVADDIDAALSKELGNFLFGESMTKILKKQGKPKSLPPDEVTSVLFDLATKLAASVPDEITSVGDPLSVRSRLVPFSGVKRPQPGSDVHLATRFLLDEAFPMWLKSFRPLPWEYRRVLWPLEDRSNFGGSTAGSLMSDDLTLETIGTGRQTVSTQRRNDVVSLIENREMNTETRGETCFLVTFYFTQKLLPKLIKNDLSELPSDNDALDSMIVFLGEYGSYLRLHTCMAYAAVLKADTVIDLLLGVAKHDLRHREVMKQTARWNQLVFYEPTMLTAIVQRLYSIHAEKTLERKTKLIEVCSAAYPDIRPWQVKKQCMLLPTSKGTSDAVLMAKLYYTYLTLLLHPSEGNDIARRDTKLVAEWCELSVDAVLQSDGNDDCLSNFLGVATRSRDGPSVYVRDLELLLTLSLKLQNHSLALDVVGEILDAPALLERMPILDVVLSQIREIGYYVLDSDEPFGESSELLLKRMLLLFSKETIREATSVASELANFIERIRRSKGEAESNTDITQLIELFAKEAIPSDILQALAIPSSLILGSEIYPAVQIILSRGAFVSMPNELSTSRLRLRQAREQVAKLQSTTHIAIGKDSEGLENRFIWRNMGNGMLSIEK